MGFKAINEATKVAVSSTGETHEAQEARITKEYEGALQLIHTGSGHEAQATLESLLQEPLLQGAASATAVMRQVRFLVTRNLADLLADQDAFADRALGLYDQALAMDGGDPALWNRMGTLAAELGHWGIARHVLEQGLLASPRHLLILEKLAEVLLHIHDFDAAAASAEYLLKLHPGHPRASQLSICLANLGIPATATGTQPRLGATQAAKDALMPQFPKRFRGVRQPSTPERKSQDPPPRLDLPKLSWNALLRGLLGMLKGEAGHPQAQVGRCLQVTVDSTPISELALDTQDPLLQPTVIALDSDASGSPPHQGRSQLPEGPSSGLVIEPADEQPAGALENHVAGVCPGAQDAALGAAALDDAAAGGVAQGGQLAAPQDAPGVSAAATEIQGGTGGERSAVLEPGTGAGTGNGTAGEAGEERRVEGNAATTGAEAEPMLAASEGKKGAQPKMGKPQRASRRLVESKRKADNDDDDGENQRNVIAAISPFLGSRPLPLFAKTPQTATTQRVPHRVIDESREHEELHGFLLQHTVNNGAASLAVNALQKLTVDYLCALPEGVPQQLLELDMLLRGWECSRESALMLAELHLDRALDLDKSARVAALRPGTAGKPAMLKKGQKTLDSPQVSAMGPHMQAALSSLGAFTVAALELDASSVLNPSGLQSPGKLTQADAEHDLNQRQLAARYRWAQGRYAEQCRRDAQAASHFAACLEICSGQLALPGPFADPAPSGGNEPREASEEDAVLPGPAPIAPSELPPLSIRLVNCKHDAQISRETAAARKKTSHLLGMVENGQQLLQQHRQAEVVQTLAPAVLKRQTENSVAFDKRTHLRALTLLKEAAASFSDDKHLSLELHARLMHVTQRLRRVPEDVQDAELHTASVKKGNRPPGVAEMVDAAKPKEAEDLFELTRVVQRVATQAATLAITVSPSGQPGALPMETEDGSTGLASGQMSGHGDHAEEAEAATVGNVDWRQFLASVGDLVTEVQWKLLVFAERCYWHISPKRKSNTAKDAVNREALLGALQGICALQQLVTTTSSTHAVAESVYSLLAAAFQVLSERRAVTLRSASFPKFCVARLTATLDQLRTGGAQEEDDSSQGLPQEELEQALESAIAQCLFAAYGLQLDHRDVDWGGGVQEGDVAKNALSTLEECLAVWPFVHSYAEGIKRDEKKLARLQGVLDKFAVHFPSPPPAVVAACRAEALLDDPLLSEEDLLSQPRPAFAERLLAPSEELLSEVAQDPHRNVHSHLFQYRLLVEAPELNMDGIARTEKGDAAVAKVMQLAVADLCYNPTRHATWECIRGVYQTASLNLVEELCKEVPAPEVPIPRLTLYRRRAHRALLLTRQLVPAGEAGGVGDESFCEEELGMTIFRRVRNVPPFFDQMKLLPVKDEAYRAACLESAKAFQRAAAVLPEEWLFQHHLGKMLAKHGAPPEEYLPRFARACHFAASFVGGKIEPLYRLHATRLKLLLSGEATVELLRRFCFLEDTSKQLAALVSCTANSSAHAAETAAVDAPAAASQAARDAVEAPSSLGRSLGAGQEAGKRRREDVARSEDGSETQSDEPAAKQARVGGEESARELDSLGGEGGSGGRAASEGSQGGQAMDGVERGDEGNVAVGQSAAPEGELSGVRGRLPAESANCLILKDCMEALRFCLEQDRSFHKAHFRLARTHEALGAEDAACEELRHLFQRGRRPFGIFVDQIDDTDAQEYGSGKKSQSQRLEQKQAPSTDEVLWGRKPARLSGSGVLHDWRKHLGSARKYLVAYLQLLARVGDAERLGAAVACLKSQATKDAYPGTGDILRLALGLHMTNLAARIREAAPHAVKLHSFPGTPQVPLASTAAAAATITGQQPAESRGNAEVVQLDEDALHRDLPEASAPLLECAFQVYAEHSLHIEGGRPDASNSWEGAVLPALAACANFLPEPELLGTPWVAEAAFGEYAKGYIIHLEKAEDADRLSAIASKLSKRFNPKQPAAAPIKDLARLLAAACGRTMWPCFRRLEAACAARKQAAAEVAIARENAVEGPGAPAPAKAPQMSREASQQLETATSAASGEDAAGEGQGATGPYPTQSNEGSPQRTRHGPTESSRRISRSPMVTARRHQSDPPTPENPLAVILAEGFKKLRQLHSMYRWSRQLQGDLTHGVMGFTADTQEEQAGRSAILVGAVVAYFHMAHSQELRLAPLSAGEADAICTELIKQARNSQGPAPIPTLEGRLETGPQSMVESPPPVPPVVPQPQPAAIPVRTAAGQQLPPMAGRQEGEPHTAEVSGSQGHATVRETRGRLHEPHGEASGAGNDQQSRTLDPTSGPVQGLVALQTQGQQQGGAPAALAAALQDGSPVPTEPAHSSGDAGIPMSPLRPVRQVMPPRAPPQIPGVAAGAFAQQPSQNSSAGGGQGSTLPAAGASAARTAQPQSRSWLLDLVREVGQGPHALGAGPAAPAVGGGSPGDVQGRFEPGGSGMDCAQEGEPAAKRARMGQEVEGGQEGGAGGSTGLLALIDELSNKSRQG